MLPHLFFYQLAVLGLLGLCVLLHAAWPSRGTTAQGTPATPIIPRRQRAKEPQPCAGLPTTPPCALGAQEAAQPQAPPPVPPEPRPPPHRRPRTVDTFRHFCPHAGCRDRGWLGLGHLRANGHPHGSPWRQCHCTACTGSFPEHHGPLFHGTQAAVELIVRVVACRAAGLGLRATARGFEVEPNTGWHWLGAAAAPLRAFSAYCLGDLQVAQLQRAEWYAVVRGVKAGEIGAAPAIKRLERSRHWVWTAIEPECTLRVTMEVGPRTLEMAQRVVHQLGQGLTPGCVPLFVTDGFRQYMPAFLAHFGHGPQPPRRQAPGPASKPRWMPRPARLYAQLVQAYRRRGIVGGPHRGVCGTRLAMEPTLARWAG